MTYKQELRVFIEVKATDPFIAGVAVTQAIAGIYNADENVVKVSKKGKIK